MHYVIFDLEFNMFFKFNDHQFPNPALKNEIIQIGALKLNEQLETVGEFDLIVKPVIYKRINPYVKRKTKINSSRIGQGKPFVEAIQSFKVWLGEDSVLCSWGHDDILGLRDNCLFFGFEALSFDRYIDIQKIYMKHEGLTKQPGLESAVEALEIEKTTPFHDALSDAYYTSEIFKKVFDLSGKEIVNWEKSRTENERKVKELRAVMDEVIISCPQCSGVIEKNKQVTKPKKYFAFGYCTECNHHIRHISRIVQRGGEYSIVSNNSIYKLEEAME